MSHKYLIIIAGWHFYKKGFYNQIKKLCDNNKNIDVFISSHKKETQINKKTQSVINTINNCKLVCFENVGFDWGMYSQAIAYLNNSILNYDYIFFMHDDIKIINFNFPDIFSNYLEDKNLILLGNSFNSEKINFHETHPHIIKWGENSEWNVKISSKLWTTVRGSFFAAKSCIFEKVKAIPYKKGENIRKGNWGLILFNGLVTDNFGSDSIGIMSNDIFKSPYIKEYLRGKRFPIFRFRISRKVKNFKKTTKKKLIKMFVKIYHIITFKEV